MKDENVKEMLQLNKIYKIDCLKGLKKIPDDYIQCCVTSPPYRRLRDYGIKGQLGLEETPELYTSALVEVFQEVRRVLKPDSTLWLNLGDCYWGSGKHNQGNKPIIKFGRPRIKEPEGITTTGKHPLIKPKDLIGLPWMVALGLRNNGWWLLQDVIWHKPNPMPKSVTDRCIKAHEYIFLLSKNRKYYFDYKAIRTKAKGLTLHDRSAIISRKRYPQDKINGIRKCGEPYEMANRRSVWSITTKPFLGAHFATFPIELPELCIKAGSHKGDIILDPFIGAGTTTVVAKGLQRNYIGFELNRDYILLAQKRLKNKSG